MSKVGTGGLEQINHTGDSTLQAPYDKDTVEYRYRGSKPNNYVVFNNELWRIIGVLPTDDGTGNIENKIKIIKNNSINNIYWNNCATSDSETCTQTGKNLNDWTGASLNDYLNGDYYNSFTREAQNMIEQAKYYLGGYDDTDSLVNSMWSRERKMSGSSYDYENNPTSTVSKIALMYVSDYGYAASDECDESVDSYDEDICKSNNWLYSGKYEWFLNPSSNNSYYVHNLYSNGRVSEYSHVYGESQAIRPVLTLTPEVVISDGSGTESDPYMLS